MGVQLNKDEYENPYDLLQKKLKNERSDFSMRPEKEPKTAIVEKFLDSPDMKPEKQMISPQKKPSLESNPSISEFDDVYKTKYANLKFFPKLKRLLYPFSFAYYQKWVNL